MLADLIQNLQNKSEHTKIKILYFSGALTVVVVLMAWVSSFGEYKAALNNPLGDNKSVKTLKASVADSMIETQKLSDDLKAVILDTSSTNKNKDEQIGSQKLENENLKSQTKTIEIEEIEEKKERGGIGAGSIDPKKEENKVFKLPIE